MRVETSIVLSGKGLVGTGAARRGAVVKGIGWTQRKRLPETMSGECTPKGVWMGTGGVTGRMFGGRQAGQGESTAWVHREVSVGWWVGGVDSVQYV